MITVKNPSSGRSHSKGCLIIRYLDSGKMRISAFNIAHTH